LRAKKGNHERRRYEIIVEARVAIAITASFVALTLGAMTQENSGSATRRHAQNSRVNVGGLTKDGSLEDIATAEVMRGTDHFHFHDRKQILNH